jgi:hypothetical protein
VVTLHLLSLTVLLSLPLPVAPRIQTAFLQNSPAILRELLTADGTIPVSLPEPLSLADQLSPDQAYLAFSRFFSIFKTTEFITYAGVSSLAGVPGGILKARWSFRNGRTGAQHAFHLYFFVVLESPPRSPRARGPLMALKIVEIRAERL